MTQARQRKVAILFGLMLLLMLGTLQISAQNATGKINGYISDATGAIMPGVNVEATNVSTNYKFPATTDETGHYQILDLPVGTYDLSVQQAGFKAFQRTGVVIDAATNNRVDVQLEVGTATEQVTVSGIAPQVDTSMATVGSTIDRKQISDLPLNGRDVGRLVTLAPGTNNYSNVNWWGFPTTFVTSNGSYFQNRGTEWLLNRRTFQLDICEFRDAASESGRS